MPGLDLLLLAAVWQEKEVLLRVKVLLTVLDLTAWVLIFLYCYAGLVLQMLLCGIMGCWDLRRS
jgi:hypothetical protein